MTEDSWVEWNEMEKEKKSNGKNYDKSQMRLIYLFIH